MKRNSASKTSQPFHLEKSVKAKIVAIKAVEDLLPGVVIIHNIQTRSVEYMSKWGLEILQTSMQELRDMGEAYFDHFLNPQDAQNYAPKFIEMLEKRSVDQISYFQQVRPNGQEEWDWYVSTTKVFACNETGEPHLLITTAHPVNELKSITYKMERLIDERKSMLRDLPKYRNLTKREREILKLMVEGRSSTEIADLLYIAHATVLQHRKNIKTKTGLKTLPELVLFAQVFNII